jgi:hypothetical protein
MTTACLYAIGCATDAMTGRVFLYAFDLIELDGSVLDAVSTA